METSKTMGQKNFGISLYLKKEGIVVRSRRWAIYEAGGWPLPTGSNEGGTESIIWMQPIPLQDDRCFELNIYCDEED